MKPDSKPELPRRFCIDRTGLAGGEQEAGRAALRAVVRPWLTVGALGVSLLLLIALSTGCSQPASAPTPVLLRLAGSTSMQPLMRDLASAYSARSAHVSFEFSAVGSTAGLETLRRGSADLALVSRPVDAQEEVDISTGTRNLFATVLARDAVAVIVNQRNPLRNLSAYELRNLFEGQIPDWGEIEGTTGNAVIVSREDGSGTRVVFEATAMRGHRVTSTALVMPGSEAVRNCVAAHQEAIGYMSVGWLGPGVEALTIDGVAASRESIERGTYPLLRPFIVVRRADAAAEAFEFLAFITSPSGQAIVRRTYGAPSAGQSSQ